MRVLTPSIVVVLGLALAPAAGMAQSIKGATPTQNGLRREQYAACWRPRRHKLDGADAGRLRRPANTKPVGGPGINGYSHNKSHKRAHHKFYGRHHDYTRSSPLQGSECSALQDDRHRVIHC